MKSLLAVTILLAVGALGTFQVEGQATATKKAQRTKSSRSVKTRVRRAAGPTVTNQTVAPADNAATEQAAAPVDTIGSNSEPAKPSDAADASSAKPSQTVSQSVETATPVEPKENSRPADPVQDLRDQIAAAATSQERVSLQLKLVELLVSSGQRTDALTELKSIVASDEFNPQGLYNAGNSFARLGETDGAVSAYRKAIDQKNGQYSRALNNLGVVLLRAGRWDEAYDALLSALKIESFHYAEASYNLGRLYAARGDNDLAIREWRRTLKVDPHHTAAAQALANIGSEDSVVVGSENVVARADRVKSGRTTQPNTTINDRAQPVAATPKSAVRKVPGSTVPARVFTVDSTTFEFLQQARNSTERGKVLDAIAAYRKVLSRQGGYFPPANLELSYLLLSVKRYDEAQANLLQVSSRDGNRFPLSYFHLARVYELKGDLQLAETTFARAVEAFGTRNAQFLLDLSRVREKQGNFKGALDAMEQYVSIMKGQGQEPSWSDERLTALRQKISPTAPK